MVIIEPDVAKNVLILEMIGTPSADDLPAAERAMASAIARLRPPFGVLSDVRRLESLEAVPLDGFARLAGLLRDAKVSRVVRVVGKSQAAAVQLERLSRAMRHSAHLAFSREEAWALLGAVRGP